MLVFGCAQQNGSSVENPSVQESSLTSESSAEASSIVVSSSEKPAEQSAEASSQQSSSSPYTISTPTQSSSQTQSSIETSFTPSISGWEGVSFNQYGESFRRTLASLIKGGTTSYNNCLDVGARVSVLPLTASIPSKPTQFIPFYLAPVESNLTTTGSCNREHTWPNSRGGGSIEKDPIVIRPTLPKDNSGRGNNVCGYASSKEWDPASCGYENARGEAARVILYAATRYADKGLSLSNDPGDDKTLKTMGTLKTLLEWNNKYAPSAFERTVNERYETLGYARNPFVDYPDFANYIWDANGYRTSAYTSTINPDDYTSSAGSVYSFSENPIEESSESGSGYSTALELTSADFPTSYATSETEREMQGVNWKHYQAMAMSNTIQLKKSAGYFYNLDRFDYDKLVITVAKGDPIVYGGTSANPSKELVPTLSEASWSYDISEYPFIKIKSYGPGVTNLSSVSFA